MIRWLKKFINLILPPRCLICGKIIENDNALCPECFNHITFITKPYCLHCGRPLSFTNLDKDLCCPKCLTKKDSVFYLCRSAIEYDEYSKKLILDFKFSDHLENRYLLTQWLIFAGKDIFDTHPDIILPVPLHYSRLFQRKYNQSAILVRELSKKTHIPAYYNILKKCRYTKPQVICSGKQRRKNIKDAFVVTKPDFVRDKNIILIDDVYTTGSTLKECAKVLKKCGAKNISTLTIARVVE